MYGKETERRTLEHGKHEPIMIEEKNQTNGTVLRRYTRGKMLGKVQGYIYFRVALLNAMSYYLMIIIRNTL